MGWTKQKLSSFRQINMITNFTGQTYITYESYDSLKGLDFNFLIMHINNYAQ
jgi:hypothetical protein